MSYILVETRAKDIQRCCWCGDWLPAHHMKRADSSERACSEMCAIAIEVWYADEENRGNACRTSHHEFDPPGMPCDPEP